MSAKKLLGTRITVMVILALLALQFELGMAVNISNLQRWLPLGFPWAQFRMH